MQPHMLERGLTYRGSGEALRRFVAKLESGQRVVVSALGGSVTRGHGGGPDSMNAEKGFPGSWSRHVFDFIQVRERRDGRATLRVCSLPPAGALAGAETRVLQRRRPRYRGVLLCELSVKVRSLRHPACCTLAR